MRNYDNMKCLLECLLSNTAIHVDTQNNDGKTPLHWAAVRNNPTAVRMFIENDCNINIKDNKGETALDNAKECNMDEIITLLEAA